MATLSDRLRRQIARLEEIAPNSRLLRDYKNQLLGLEYDKAQNSNDPGALGPTREAELQRIQVGMRPGLGKAGSSKGDVSGESSGAE